MPEPRKPTPEPRKPSGESAVGSLRLNLSKFGSEGSLAVGTGMGDRRGKQAADKVLSPRSPRGLIARLTRGRSNSLSAAGDPVPRRPSSTSFSNSERDESLSTTSARGSRTPRLSPMRASSARHSQSPSSSPRSIRGLLSKLRRSSDDRAVQPAPVSRRRSVHSGLSDDAPVFLIDGSPATTPRRRSGLAHDSRGFDSPPPQSPPLLPSDAVPPPSLKSQMSMPQLLSDRERMANRANAPPGRKPLAALSSSPLAGAHAGSVGVQSASPLSNAQRLSLSPERSNASSSSAHAASPHSAPEPSPIAALGKVTPSPPDRLAPDAPRRKPSAASGSAAEERVRQARRTHSSSASLRRRSRKSSKKQLARGSVSARK